MSGSNRGRGYGLGLDGQLCLILENGDIRFRPFRVEGSLEWIRSVPIGNFWVTTTRPPGSQCQDSRVGVSVVLGIYRLTLLAC